MSKPSDDNETKAVHVRIEGRVQGVWYRGWTSDCARELGLAGWVRNRSDGTVEAVFAGVPEAVETMLAACWKGPPAAHVTAVTPKPCPPPETAAFETRPTE